MVNRIYDTFSCSLTNAEKSKYYLVEIKDGFINGTEIKEGFILNGTGIKDSFINGTKEDIAKRIEKNVLKALPKRMQMLSQNLTLTQKRE